MPRFSRSTFRLVVPLALVLLAMALLAGCSRGSKSNKDGNGEASAGDKSLTSSVADLVDKAKSRFATPRQLELDARGRLVVRGKPLSGQDFAVQAKDMAVTQRGVRSLELNVKSTSIPHVYAAVRRLFGAGIHRVVVDKQIPLVAKMEHFIRQPLEEGGPAESEQPLDEPVSEDTFESPGSLPFDLPPAQTILVIRLFAKPDGRLGRLHLNNTPVRDLKQLGEQLESLLASGSEGETSGEIHILPAMKLRYSELIRVSKSIMQKNHPTVLVPEEDPNHQQVPESELELESELEVPQAKQLRQRQ